MATKIKISQLPAKGANLEATDLLEVSEFNGTGYVTKSITGQEIIDAVSSGGVSSVSGTAPILSSGGTTPDISITQADTGSDGYLTSADYITFTNKQEALVSGTNIKTINGSSVLGSGNLTISGGGASGIHALLKLTTGQVTSPAVTATTMSSTALIANRLISLPFIPAQTFTCSNLYINAATAVVGGLGRILIYSDVNGIPTTKLYESADFDLSTAGIKTATTSFTFTAGTTYWLTIHSNSNNSVSALGVGSLMLVRTNGVSQVSAYSGSATFGSAPTTYPSLIFLTSTTPCVFITAS